MVKKYVGGGEIDQGGEIAATTIVWSDATKTKNCDGSEEEQILKEEEKKSAFELAFSVSKRLISWWDLDVDKNCAKIENIQM